MRQVNDLMDCWAEQPPPHVALHRVFLALGGKVSAPSAGGALTTRITTPEQLAAEFGMTLGGPNGNG